MDKFLNMSKQYFNTMDVIMGTKRDISTSWEICVILCYYIKYKLTFKSKPIILIPI